jgi:hypothetical protein
MEPTPPVRTRTPVTFGSQAGRSATAFVAASLALVCLTACGSHRLHVSAGTTTTPPTAPPPTPTTVEHHHHHRPAVTGPLAPLTGLPVTAAAAKQVAVVVKIDNVSAALPQSGVGQADVVYEEMVEGGLTRLAAVFQSQYPSVVGPVRSGRLTDEGIADDLGHPVLAFAGANAVFLPQLEAQPLSVVDDDNFPAIYYRDNSRAAPHNLYAGVGSIAATASGATPPPALWKFRTSGRPFTGAGITPAASVSIPFPDATAGWTWNGRDNLWLRSQNGAVDTDSTGVQYSAANVIVQFVPYTISGYVSGEGAAAQGTPIPTGELVGSGAAWFLSDGELVKGHWTRSSLTAPTVYTDSAGVPVKLQPGRTWVELPPVGTAVSVNP